MKYTKKNTDRSCRLANEGAVRSSKLYGTKPGVSLLISLILVSILVIFGIGVSNLVISSIRESANVNQANQAYYAAEGGMEVGLLENKNKDAGYDATLADVYYNGSGKPGEPGVLLSKVKIQGTVPASSQIGGEYVMPRPGTGTAGTGCDPLDPPVDVSDSTKGIDHACNWNKIKVGETVGIPLYTTMVDPADTSKTIIKNPEDLDLQTLKVKVRTPCLEGAAGGPNSCTSSGRYRLDDYNGVDTELKCTSSKPDLCGDTVVSWSIVGSNLTGDKVYTLVPYDVFDSSLKKRIKSNSETYEWLINSVRSTGSPFSGFSCVPYCVLYGGRFGVDPLDDANPGTVLDFLLNGTVDPWFVRSGMDKINKPVLKLSVIGSLSEFSSGDAVPYLEYQIVSNIGVGGSAPPDLAQTITAEGFSGPFKQVLEVKLPQETGLLEYVIQQ
ncbi:pilus assembly PilX N-terminal domain-containing protein [Candidatus Peregrinibacteria bacterium]|nr:pilus assembly PilX N-terminal domain-containing protein [Candidatus Peregrinibacteria bacterium]